MRNLVIGSDPDALLAGRNVVKTIPLAILAFLDSAQDADDHFDVILDVGGVITRFR